MQKYLKLLKQIDIGIAMINGDDFSQGRSDGKFLEYASLQAMLLHRNNHFEDAMGIYMNLLEIAPEFHVIWMRLGELYQTTGSEEQADICSREMNRLTAQYY